VPSAIAYASCALTRRADGIVIASQALNYRRKLKRADPQVIATEVQTGMHFAQKGSEHGCLWWRLAGLQQALKKNTPLKQVNEKWLCGALQCPEVNQFRPMLPFKKKRNEGRY
jgi:hypothetical protein